MDPFIKLLAAGSVFIALVSNSSTIAAAEVGESTEKSEQPSVHTVAQSPNSAPPDRAGMDKSAGEAETQAKARFDVIEYRVLGNSVLPGVEIEATLYSLLGPGKTIDDVERARAALEARYHDRGYGTVFVDIPEQDVSEGVVRLKVSEGVLEHSRVTGARYFSGRKIHAALPAAAENTVPHIPTLQAQLAKLNAESPDRNVTPILKAGANPGTVDLTLNVHDELPIVASLEVNNQYSADTTPLRAIGTLGYNDMFARLDSLSVQYQNSPQEPTEVDVWAASYTGRVSDGGTKLTGFFVNSDSDVATAGDGGSTINVLGKGKIYGLRSTTPLRADAEATHMLLGGLEYKDFTESIFSKSMVLTPITYINASLGNASAWRGEQRQWTLTSSVNLGLRGQLNSTQEFRLKRSNGVPNYFLLRADGSVTQKLPLQMALRLRATGQYAIDSIISNEQFSIAGADGVRGDLEAEVLGDIGIKSSLELSALRLHWFKDDLQMEWFGFFDYGRMTRLNPLRDNGVNSPTFGMLLEPVNVTLRSTGVGLNLSVLQHFSGALVWAYPLDDTPVNTGTRADTSRVLFSVRASW
jgi:hemolysin activation/secretion protein